MKFKTIIYNNEKDMVCDGELQCVLMKEFLEDDILPLQEDMYNHGYMLNIFEVYCFWYHYSDTRCASFLGYTKGSFNDDYINDIIEGEYSEPVDCYVSELTKFQAMNIIKSNEDFKTHLNDSDEEYQEYVNKKYKMIYPKER